ncbi:TPA: phage tail protein, partial [Pseudomonas aeruginosa]
GAVIQRGSNANGEFVRFADGTQICAGVSSTALVCSVATGGGFQSGGVAALYFPAAFSAAPSVSPVPAFREGATARAWLSMNPPSASVVTLISHGFVDRAEVMPGYIAFGRWY